MSPAAQPGARHPFKLPPLFFVASALSGLLLGLAVLGLVSPTVLPPAWTFQHSLTALGAGLGLECWAVILLLRALRAARKPAGPA